MAPKQQAPKASSSRRKAVPKNPRGKAAAAPVPADDDFQGEKIDVSDPCAATWLLFDNDACHCLVPLFNEDVIENSPSNMVASVLRTLFPLL
jgi:hypothetical protein